MKHLKIYENYQTKREVAKICKKYGITNWSINQDGLVDVAGDVYLSQMYITELPLKFGIVSGNFFCNGNGITNLEGAPYSVGGDFDCNDNMLITLEGSPHSVDGFFDCSSNKLTTLEGAPESVGSFFCTNNQLTTLKGAPYSVGDYFWCHNNPLPDLIKRNNMKSIKHILANQEMYHIYNKDGTINEYRFQLMMDSMD